MVRGREGRRGKRRSGLESERERESFLIPTERGESERDNRLEKKVAALEELLASKLAEFLDGVFSYSLSQLSSAAKTHLYKGPPDITTSHTKTTSSSSSFVSADSKPHPLKGGWIIQDYLTYDW